MGTEQQLPLAGGASRSPSPPAEIQPPTPTEQRRMLINGVADFNRSFPPGPGEPQTAEEAVDEALAKGVVRLETQEALLDRYDAAEQDVAAALARGEITHIISAGPDGIKVTVVPQHDGVEPARPGNAVYSIQHQAQIECRALVDGGVEITQAGQHGPDEDATIHVAAGNVVRLARLLLLAAGFRDPGVISDTGRGCVDLIDGDTAAGHNSEFPSRR